METDIWTVHARKDRDLEVIADRFDVFALVLPVLWMIWHGTWISLGGLAVLLVAAGLYTPIAVMPVMYAVAIALAFEGSALRRLELRLWGWKTVGLVEATTPEGAEEQFVSGNRTNPA